MKHFWLDDEQQAIMDAATSTAAQYGHVALMRTERAWKRATKALLCSPVAGDDHLKVQLRRGALKRFPNHPNSFLRLNGKQAMAFKLRFDNGENTRLVGDPTGEIWGNIQLVRCESEIGKHYLKHFNGVAARDAFEEFRGKGDPFGPTLATVGDHCKGLPLSWGKALVWDRAADWADADQPVNLPTSTSRVTYDPASGSVITDLFTYTRDAFSAPVERKGQKWAREWWVKCQNASHRKVYCIDDQPGEPIL